MPTTSRLIKPALLTLAFAALVALGLSSTPWAAAATPTRNQSVPPIPPIATPLPTAQPEARITPPSVKHVAGETREIVRRKRPQVVHSGDWYYTYRIPAGVLTQSGTVRVRPLPADATPPSEPGFTMVRYAVELTMYDRRGAPMAGAPFEGGAPLVCFNREASDGALVVRSFDAATGAWVSLPTTVVDGLSCAPSSATAGTFALFAASPK